MTAPSHLRHAKALKATTTVDLDCADRALKDILAACAQHGERMDSCESYEDREEEMGGFVNLMIVKASAIRRALGLE